MAGRLDRGQIPVEQATEPNAVRADDGGSAVDNP